MSGSHHHRTDRHEQHLDHEDHEDFHRAPEQHGHANDPRQTPGAAHLDAHHRGRLGDRRRMLIALALTATLFVVEVVGGILSHSLALLSDAGHMLSDFGAQGLSLAALIIAARPSDRRRTYGYYRIEILAALANGVALFALSGWIVWSAWHRLRDGQQPIETGIMMGVAAVGLCANLAGAWLLHGAESLNVKGAYLHVLQDTLSSVAVLAHVDSYTCTPPPRPGRPPPRRLPSTHAAGAAPVVLSAVEHVSGRAPARSFRRPSAHPRRSPVRCSGSA